MKLKVNPEDFKVEEKISLSISETYGTYRVYRLIKRNWNTIDAIRAACVQNNVPFEKVRYGGRKDRLAVTAQFITAPSDCDISFKRHNVLVEPEGYSEEPMSPTKISGNLFTVTIRDMSENEADTLHDALLKTSVSGFINYFDDQRFGRGRGKCRGEVANSTHFFAELLIKRQYDRAIRALLCNCHPEAPVYVKKRKQIMAANWGNWSLLRDTAADKNEIAICDALLKDSSTSGLLKILRDIPKDEFGMYLSAYQSFIWNETCAELIRETPETEEIPTIASDILPAAPDTLKVIHSVLAKRGVRPSKLKLAEFKECGYLASFMRAVKSYPEIFEITKNEDDLFKPRFKLTAKFLLQSGSYATMLLKQIS